MSPEDLQCVLHVKITKNFLFYSLGGWVVSFCAVCWSWFWSFTTLDCYVAPVGMTNMLLQQPEAVSPTLEETFLWRKFHLPGTKKIKVESWFGWVFAGHRYEKNLDCYLGISAENRNKYWFHTFTLRDLRIWDCSFMEDLCWRIKFTGIRQMLWLMNFCASPFGKCKNWGNW